MNFTWKYGKEIIEFNVPDHSICGVITRETPQPSGEPAELVREALKNPIGTPRLKDMLKIRQPQSVVVVVNDITRPTPYHAILAPLFEEIEEAGVKPERVTLLVATGIHRPHSDEENRRIYGGEIVDRCRVVNHNPDKELKSFGLLKNGSELLVNRTAAEADFLITTGLIGLHYFAGYSGGRKSIVPGIAGRTTIEASHAMMADPRAELGNINNNPVHEVLEEAALRVGVDFIVNVITDDEKQVIAAVSGHVVEAWRAGVTLCERFSICTIPEPAGIVVAGCGGHPKDINLYQAQKALDAVAGAVRPGGVIVLAARCEEGLGEETFARWVSEANSIHDIFDRFGRKFELGGHKAYAIARLRQKARLVLVSDLEPELARRCFMEPFNDMDQAIDYARSLMGKDESILVVPEAPSLAVRVLNDPSLQ